ncbi:MAG TPA: hypothetical protein VGL69_03260 [Solirubrobacteraceae bacterium]|jgi:hypothetical protein
MLADRWNVTDAETRRRYPCDEIVAAPALEAWRGVTVATPPERVWPWIVQIRVAPYSYDWIDNLGRRSPQRLLDLPDPVVGDFFTTAAGRSTGRVLAVAPGEHLTARIMGTVMSYVLVPQERSTRLLLKLVTRRSGRLGPLLCLGDLVMARRQLLNLARLAQQDGTQ